MGEVYSTVPSPKRPAPDVPEERRRSLARGLDRLDSEHLSRRGLISKARDFNHNSVTAGP